MPEQEQIIELKPASFVPSISFGGTESRYIIRGQNLWLRSKAENTVYCGSYRGSFDVNEDIDAKLLTGSIEWSPTDPQLIIGTGTAFQTELKPGSFLVTRETPSNFFVIDEVIDDTNARISRPLAGTLSGIS